MSRRKLLLAVAAAAATAGAVVAVVTATSGGGHARHAHSTARAAPAGDLALAARYLGITRAQLRRRLRGETLAQVANATPGRSARGLEHALLAARSAEWSSHGVPAAEQSARAKRLRERIDRAMLRPLAVSDLRIAARYLAISEAALRRELLAGRSLASIAGSKAGTSRAGLIAAIYAAHRKRLEAERAAHVIDAQVEHAALTGLQQRVTREVERRLGTS